MGNRPGLWRSEWISKFTGHLKGCSNFTVQLGSFLSLFPPPLSLLLLGWATGQCHNSPLSLKRLLFSMVVDLPSPSWCTVDELRAGACPPGSPSFPHLVPQLWGSILKIIVLISFSKFRMGTIVFTELRVLRFSSVQFYCTGPMAITNNKNKENNTIHKTQLKHYKGCFLKLVSQKPDSHNRQLDID